MSSSSTSVSTSGYAADACRHRGRRGRHSGRRVCRLLRYRDGAAEEKLVPPFSFAVAVSQVVIINRFWGPAATADFLAAFFEFGAHRYHDLRERCEALLSVNEKPARQVGGVFLGSDVDDGPEEVPFAVLVVSDAYDVVPEREALLGAPTLVPLEDGDDELFGAIEQSGNGKVLCVHVSKSNAAFCWPQIPRSIA